MRKCIVVRPVSRTVDGLAVVVMDYAEFHHAEDVLVVDVPRVVDVRVVLLLRLVERGAVAHEGGCAEALSPSTVRLPQWGRTTMHSRIKQHGDTHVQDNCA